MATTKTANPMTPGREAVMLIQHGTVKQTLPPAVLVQTAKADLRARDFNAQQRARATQLRADGLNTKGVEPARKYGFVGEHVRGAKSPAGVLRAALADIEAGRRDSKSVSANTLRLYADPQILQQAIDLAEAEERAAGEAAPMPDTGPDLG